MQCLPYQTLHSSDAEWCLNYVVFLLLGDCRKANDPPLALLHHVSDQVILMQALHDNDDAAGALVIESAVKSVVVPLIYRRPLGVGEGLIRLQSVVYDNEVRAAASQNASDGGCQPEALLSGRKFLH